MPGRRPNKKSNQKQAQIDTYVALANPCFGEDPNAETNVGQRLHDLRVERGLSIRSLAEISGLAVNTLSLIENGKTSPSVKTLQQLACALRIPIICFFEACPNGPQVIHTQPEKRPIKHLENNTTIEDLGIGYPNWKAQPILVTLEANAKSEETPIVHTGHEFIYCLSGTVEYTINNKSYLLKAGDTLLFESHLPHQWQNKGESEAKIILLLSPNDDNESPMTRHFHFQSV
jgi:transcriptional regulator with XRE-family HTH domain